MLCECAAWDTVGSKEHPTGCKRSIPPYVNPLTLSLDFPCPCFPCVVCVHLCLCVHKAMSTLAGNACERSGSCNEAWWMDGPTRCSAAVCGMCMTMFCAGATAQLCKDMAGTTLIFLCPSLSLCLFVCLFVCLSVCLPVCLPACLSVSVCHTDLAILLNKDTFEPEPIVLTFKADSTSKGTWGMVLLIFRGLLRRPSLSLVHRLLLFARYTITMSWLRNVMHLLSSFSALMDICGRLQHECLLHGWRLVYR